MAKGKRLNQKYEMKLRSVSSVFCFLPLAFSLLSFAMFCLLCFGDWTFAGTRRSECVECHRKVTPGIVQQHLQGKMAKSGVDCSACHGSEHKKMDDAKLAKLPNAMTCAGCHKKQADQFKSDKHICWNKNTGEEANYRYGNAQCDACHSRHLFSKLEAQNPNVCRACHTLQWEIWSTSRHGIIWEIEGKWSKRVPSCRTCHMRDGNHSIMGDSGKIVRICTKCHGAGYIKTEFDAADCSKGSVDRKE